MRPGGWLDFVVVLAEVMLVDAVLGMIGSFAPIGRVVACIPVACNYVVLHRIVSDDFVDV